jgi:tryptophan halogenase
MTAELGITQADQRLRNALNDIERPMLMERSVKSVESGLIAGRYLISFPRAALGPGPSRKLCDILETLEAPEPEIARIDQMQSTSQSVHFGFEPDPKGTLYKCYLEFSASNRPHPDLTFIALKWDARGNHAVTLYHDRDTLSHHAQSQLVQNVLPSGPVRKTFLSLMDASQGVGALRFLEVTEPGNPRRSVDLNLAQRSVRVCDYHNDLTVLLGGGADARTYLHANANDALGHVAAGTARGGTAFGTLYHGAHRVLGGL